jgi:hypothetical protein
MLRIQVIDDDSAQVTDLGLLCEFAARFTDQVGKEFVMSFVEGMGSVTTVMTREQFRRRADRTFDALEARFRNRAVGLLDRIIQAERDKL